MEDNKSFLESYNNLLANTGKMTVADVTKTVGINVETKDFWQKVIVNIKY